MDEQEKQPNTASEAEQKKQPDTASEAEQEKKPNISSGKVPRRSRRDLVRIDELRQRLTAEGMDEEEIDSVISLYLPLRRTRLMGAALLRLDKLRLFLLAAALLVAIIFIMAFFQEKAGNFTINLDRLELYRKGISISADGDFTAPTARLTARVVEDATNITITDLPADLDEIDGDHNGLNYMAYTYYVRNAGKSDVSYIARLKIDSASKGAEYAARVAVWHNGERTVYAEPSADGTPEEGCVNFESRYVVFTQTEEDFLVGNVNKYTVVIWLEGEDPECVDAIIGGSVQFSMDIQAAEKEETTLLQKWIMDIIDTLRGTDPIAAAGTESPDYYLYKDITWDNRRNQ